VSETFRRCSVGHTTRTEKGVCRALQVSAANADTAPVTAYVFPNDVSERNRLEYQNAIIMTKLLGGKLHLAPFTPKCPPRRVLDVATGTGDWPILMGDMYPDAYVEGIDLSPIQPPLVPPNVWFFVQDALVPHIPLPRPNPNPSPQN